MHWDIDAMTREFQAARNPTADSSFFLNQLIDLIRQCNALRDFFEAEHVHRWAVGAELEPTFKTLQDARRSATFACRVEKEPRRK